MSSSSVKPPSSSIFTLPDLYIDISTGTDNNIQIAGNRDARTDVARLQKIVQCDDANKVARLGRALLKLYSLEQKNC